MRQLAISIAVAVAIVFPIPVALAQTKPRPTPAPKAAPSPAKLLAPLEFKGVRIGDDLATVKPALGLTFDGCNHSSSPSVDQVCTFGIEYAVDLSYSTARFWKEKLVAVNGAFKSADYDNLIAAMTLKHGPPSGTLTDDVQTYGGARLRARSAMWAENGANFTIIERASSIDEGAFLFAAESFGKKDGELRAQKAAKAL